MAAQPALFNLIDFKPWLTLPRNVSGLVDKPMVDILVTRNRFVHTVSRPVAGEVDGKREVSHEEANQALDDFHDRLGDFVRRINQEVSTRILGRRTAPFPPFFIPSHVPRGITQDPSTDRPPRVGDAPLAAPPTAAGFPTTSSLWQTR